MTVLSKSFVQLFYQGLSGCKHQSGFDRNFLQLHTLDKLYTYAIEQWIDVFAQRLKELQTHDFAFDWTQMGAVSKVDWAKSKNHANYYWYHLANGMAKPTTDKHICDILFAGVAIADNDREYLNTPKQFASFIYSDGFERLEFANRILKVSEHDHCLAGYDTNGDEYPISPFEIMQIKNKVVRVHPYYKPITIHDWNDFHNAYIENWRTQASAVNFENLIYPLFEIVSTYFKEIESPLATGETHNLLSAFYKQELLELQPSEVIFFLGQCIEVGDTEHSSVFLLDILLNLMQHAKQDLNAVLPLMVKLAAWITQQNPAMLIEHPDILDIYRQEEVGYYLNCNKLCKELELLLHFNLELNNEDLTLIRALSAQLSTTVEFSLLSKVTLMELFESSPSLISDLYIKIKQIFDSRDMYNQSETFTDINKTGISTGSYEYVYHRTGVNAQYIRIARLLAASGILKKFGIEDYFQLLMPDLASPVDNVTGASLSQKPLSHYARIEKDRSYLANLNNSEINYELNDTCFYNVNSEISGPFSLKEFECIQAYSAQRFRKYSRIPKFTKYCLNASTLHALIDLVNNSLNYEAAQDGDGYVLREGFSKEGRFIEYKVVEYQITDEQLRYRVRDSWNTDCVNEGVIEFKSRSKLNAFLRYSPTMRLMFILNTAIARGHARSNLSMSQYYNAYDAYTKFKQFYLQMDPEERKRLNKVSMRYSGKVRTFGEVWANGFPDCMSAASKWFSTLILDYLPMVEFCSSIEHNSKYNEYLFYARRDSQQLFKRYLLNDVTDTLDRLISLLTYVSVPTISFEGIKARGMQFLGVAVESMLAPKIVRLLSITDGGHQFTRNSMFKPTAGILVDPKASNCESDNTSVASFDSESVRNFSLFSSSSRSSSFGSEGEKTDDQDSDDAIEYEKISAECS